MKGYSQSTFAKKYSLDSEPDRVLRLSNMAIWASDRNFIYTFV